ncbi:MAG: protein O-mannosyl-transferase family [Kiritimatiellia bacterium]
MFKNLFSIETKPGAFFRRIDWTAFWGATLIAFFVYFFTLGPSVGLEDSGELATAADHLGVPHPPGYPFWSLCCWIFCRLFAWVTYMGQPTPAWAVSLFSAVAGAFAAGCTAMLICRSGSDMLDSIPSEGDEGADRARRNAVMSLAGGLGGSLVFAFSPVEWSQSTIVEIYSLNALFLMAVFLLSYRWMRRPSDRILWLTAFIFGLGLTNYQVLLLAAVPLAIIIALRNIRMFRDFCLILIPFGLTAKLLQIGSMLRADRYMSADVINKFQPLAQTNACPNEVVLGLGCALLVAAPLVGAFLSHRRDPRAQRAALGTGAAGVLLMVLAATIFTGRATWATMHETAVAPLIEPTTYAWIGAFLAGSCVCALGAAFAPKELTVRDAAVWKWLAAAGGCALVALLVAGNLRAADAAGYQGVPFSFGKPTLLLLGGVVALFSLALTTPRGLAFAIPVAAVQVTAFVLLAKGAMNGLTHPLSWWFIWPVVWNFVMLAIALVALPNGRAIATATFLAELGVSFYAYMPIVSDLRNPPMNWGYPRTWEGFKHAIMRGQYEAIKMPDFFSRSGFELFLKQLGFYFQDLRMQFTLVAAALALIPFALWKAVVRRAGGAKPRVVGATGIAAGLYVAVAVLVIVFSELCEGLTGGEVPFRLDKCLLLLLAVIALVGLVAMCARQTLVVCNMVRGRATEGSTTLFGLRSVSFSFMADDVSQQWLIAVGACFGLMSLFLVALAGVKGDIQDGFIQKVKFISSHGMFSLWIGYGLAVGLAVANRLLRVFLRENAAAQRVAFAGLCVAAGCTALIPVYENYTNDRLVFAMGSAEQNGHTFGWQFGNYQLRGANAIREELLADEEPLPNPMWPEEMEPSSIFFGGTDPGRFVPTYMIYSARVRSDVYLITQNALADDTYMSVERDLYGDEIWIPAKEDSAESFNVYVSEVQSGKRPANADLKIENGRVQVTGALGVMEINGVLTKMMFDHERLRHAFYVEESYVIQWMYPYLTPHGLIMKINPETKAMTSAIVRNDMEFWDWYQRRLLRDPAFRRDFPAQKSFSKLRAAIAGLYAHAGYFTMADQAFREAVLLYPASPEATFRYAQEVLMPMSRWDAIRDLLDYTDRVDPNNSRTDSIRRYVNKLQAVTATVTQLQAKAAKAPLTARENITLAQNLQSIGRNGQAVEAARKALAAPEGGQFELAYLGGIILAQCGQRGDAANAMKRAMATIPHDLDLRARRDMATVLMEGGLNAEAETLLNACLRLQPQDAEAWLKMALVKDALGQVQAAQSAIVQAYQIDKELANQRLGANEQLQRIAAPLFRRR